jgi:hypothetical protein
MGCFASGGWDRATSTWFGDFNVGGFYGFPAVDESTAAAIAANAQHGTAFNGLLRWPPAVNVKGQSPTGPLEYAF